MATHPTPSIPLQGVRRLMRWLHVEVDARDYGQAMSELEARHNPVFEGAPEFFLAGAKGRTKRDCARSFGNTSSKGAVFHFVVVGEIECTIHVVGMIKPYSHDNSRFTAF